MQCTLMHLMRKLDSFLIRFKKDLKPDWKVTELLGFLYCCREKLTLTFFIVNSRHQNQMSLLKYAVNKMMKLCQVFFIQ